MQSVLSLWLAVMAAVAQIPLMGKDDGVAKAHGGDWVLPINILPGKLLSGPCRLEKI